MKLKTIILLIFIVLAAVAVGFSFLIKNKVSVNSPGPSSLGPSADSAAPAIPGQKISLAWTDDNQGEDFIIRSDRKTYYGLNQIEVYFSLTSVSRQDQPADIYFWFDGQDKSVASVEKIDGQNKTPLAVSADFSMPQSVKRKDVKNYTAGDKIEDFIGDGQTNYYKVVIAYPMHSQGEFLIEAFGNLGGYGLLDPYYTSGLVGNWTFNGATTTWSTATAGITGDSSGNFNTGTMTNMSQSLSPVPGISGQALKFDGVNDYVDTGNAASLNITGDITISAWVKIVPNLTNDIISKVNAAGYGYALSIDSANIAYFLISANGTSWGTLITAGTIDAGWHHLAGVNSASGGYLYLDGVQIGTDGSPATSIVVVAKNLEIGRYSRTIEDRYFKGLIDDVRIYNRALSVGEIGDLYRTDAARLKTNTTVNKIKVGTSIAQYGPQSGLVGNWTFDGATTTWSTATAGITGDSSGNFNTGTMTNMSQSLSPIAGISGQALKFDGVDDYVSIGDTTTFKFLHGALDTSAFQWTISWWQKIDDFSIHNAIVETSPNGSSADKGIFLYINTSRKAYFVIVRGVSSTYVVNQPFASYIFPNDTSNWYYVTVTYNQALSSANAKLYVNAVYSDSGTKTASAPSTANSTGALILGTFTPATPANVLRGSLDDVRIYNRALSAGEIGDLYNLGSRKIKFK